MYRKATEMTTEAKCIRGGNGDTVMTKLLNGAEELYGKGRMFNLMTLAPGNSIGYHAHSGDNEIFFFLSGTGEYTDNGTVITIEPGDVAVCNDGDSHAVANTGSEPLVFVALILYN